jgi:hypothetical protein
VTALTDFDQDLRGLLTRMIAAEGHAPSTAELARAAGCDTKAVEASLRRLHDSHSLLLHPHSCEPWVVHPFALSAGGCWVETPARGYWANCLYCGLGIAAALGSDAVLTARFGGEGITASWRVEDGELVDTGHVFHLSVPVAHWWDNVIHACASFQPFADEAGVDPWCARHAMKRGAVMRMDQLWRFASDWYGAYLSRPWRKRTPEEVRDLFTAHGLTGPFWEV